MSLKFPLNDKYRAISSVGRVYEYYRIDTDSNKFIDIASEIKEIQQYKRNFRPSPISLPLEEPIDDKDESEPFDLATNRDVCIVSDRLLKILLRENVALMGKRPCILTCKSRNLSVPYWNIIPFKFDGLNHEALVERGKVEMADDDLSSKLGIFQIDTAWVRNAIGMKDYLQLHRYFVDPICTKKLGDKLKNTNPKLVGVHILSFI